MCPMPPPPHLIDYHYPWIAYIKRLPTAELRLTLTYQLLLTTPLEDYKQAIEVNPGFADAYNNRAILRAAQGDRTGAIEDLQKAAQLLMDGGKTAQYQQVMENLRRLQR
ncbi:MAG: tetratricopeptide repeat protein [Scytonema sp. RU_4_4]|nr:tetratricopeptide repeat protein [Scytonema sp. RU_4_4]